MVIKLKSFLGEKNRILSRYTSLYVFKPNLSPLASILPVLKEPERFLTYIKAGFA